MSLTPAGKKALAGTAVAVASTALALLLWASGGLDRWELRTWDWRARAMSRPAPATDAVRLVLLDQQSLDWAQKENGLSWPWPREVYGAIVGYLRRAGAKSIAFDVLYTEPSAYGVADDVALGDAAAGGGEFVAALFLGEKSGSVASWPEGLPRVEPRIEGLGKWLSDGKGAAACPRPGGCSPCPRSLPDPPCSPTCSTTPIPTGCTAGCGCSGSSTGKRSPPSPSPR